ncbi:MAG: CPBP family intramembrane glutamic endopeptidase, partial [Planctomycetota bacterium]
LSRFASAMPSRTILGFRRPSAASLAGWTVVSLLLVGASDCLSMILGRPVVPDVMRDAYRTAGSLPLFWLAIVVAAPLVEELIFRGLLLIGLSNTRFGSVGAAIATSAAWAVIHLQYDAHDMTTIFLFGLILAAARMTTRSIVTCLYLHSVVNLIAIIETAVIAARG